jgi:hypothetical protein
MENQTQETPKLPQLEKWAHKTLTIYDEVHEGIHEHLETLGPLALAARDMAEAKSPMKTEICVYQVVIKKDNVEVYLMRKEDKLISSQQFTFTLEQVREFFHFNNDEDYQDIKVSVSPTFSALNSNHQTSSGEDPRMPDYEYDDWGWEKD